MSVRNVISPSPLGDFICSFFIIATNAFALLPAKKKGGVGGWVGSALSVMRGDLGTPVLITRGRVEISSPITGAISCCRHKDTFGCTPWGRYHGSRRPSSDDSFHSPTVIPPWALDKPSIMKRYHRRRTCSHSSPRRSPTMVTLHDTRFVECPWWNDGWTVKTVVT